MTSCINNFADVAGLFEAEPSAQQIGRCEGPAVVTDLYLTRTRLALNPFLKIEEFVLKSTVILPKFSLMGV